MFPDGKPIFATRRHSAKWRAIRAQRQFFGGNANAFLIGEGDGEWDAVAIVKYPDADTMFKTVSSDAYRNIHKHRRAGLAGQLLISCDGDGVF